MAPIFPDGTSKDSGNQRRRAPFEPPDIWRDAPLLKGTTKFEPLPNAKNIMVTGGEGFIGSWVVRHFVETYPDYNIVSYDKLDYCATLNNTRMLVGRSNFTFYQGDITEPHEVLDCLEKHNIDTIYHLAAQSHVDNSFGNSFQFIHSNVFGTNVLLEAAKKVGIKRFIHMSTDEVYGEVQDDDKDLPETAPLRPSNPYSASKAAAELVVESFHRSFKLPIIIVRSNNVYGPHQYPEKIIPKVACLLNRGRAAVLHGDGSPTRRYLYAADAADALDTIFHKGKIGLAYNVGTHDEISNFNLSLQIIAEMGLPHSTEQEIRNWVKYTTDRPFNDRRYAVDISSLRGLGWEQKTSFAQGLSTTVEWYGKFGEQWWGDISNVLEPFPVVKDKEVVLAQELHPVTDTPRPAGGPAKKGKVAELNRLTDCNVKAAIMNGHVQSIAV